MASSQTLIGIQDTDVGTATTYSGFGDMTWDSVETDAEGIISEDGTFKNLYINTDDTLTGGETRNITLRVNGSSSTLSATMNSSNPSSANDTVNTVSVTAGDRVNVISTGSHGTAFVHWSMEFVADTNNQQVLIAPAGSNEFENQFGFIHGGGSGWNATESNRQLRIGSAGTIKRLFIRFPVAPGSGNTKKIEVFKNGSGTGLTCSVADTAKTNSDLVNTVSVVEGDLLSVKSTYPVGSPASGRVNIGMTFEPTLAQEFFWMGTTNNTSTSGVEYSSVDGGQLRMEASATSKLVPVAVTRQLKGIKVFGKVALTGSMTLACDLMVNDVSQVTLTLDSSNQSKEDTTTKIEVVAGDTIHWKTTPTNSATEQDLTFWIKSPIPTYKLEGDVRDLSLDTVGTVRCVLLKHDNATEASRIYSIIDHVNANGSGLYSFTGIIDNDSRYLVIAYNDETTDRRGVTSDNLIPVVE